MRKTIHSPEQNVLVNILKAARDRAGLKQEEVAERLGKPQAFVSRYEAGQRRLDLPELEQVCGALGISLPTLVKEYVERMKAERRQG
jgi:transcriptional regulator with XRE-family HTH domain